MTPPKVALLGIPYDASSSYQRGPAGAPVAIREALWSEAGNAWTEPGTDLKDGRLDDEGDLWFNEREPGPEARARIEDAVGSIVDSGRRPLLLGGDHSITYPALRGVRHHHKKLAILHLDAHPDLYHEFQGDRYSHACPFARIMEEHQATSGSRRSGSASRSSTCGAGGTACRCASTCRSISPSTST